MGNTLFSCCLPGRRSKTPPPTPPSLPGTEKFSEIYDYDRDDSKKMIVLGLGTTGFVAKCHHRVINKEDVSSRFRGRHISDAQIMSLMDHPNIVGLEEAFESKDKTCIVMELLQGVELSSHLAKEKILGEGEARPVIFQIASALTYMHSMGIVHRDIKPENILINTTSDEVEVKVIDFGEGDKLVEGGVSLKPFWGTKDYVAPEMFLGGYFTKKADVWALGVTIYCMLCGEMPSFGDDYEVAGKMDKEKASEKSPLCFNPLDEEYLSTEAMDFLVKLLAVDPEARFSASQVLDHPWLGEHEPDSSIYFEVD